MSWKPAKYRDEWCVVYDDCKGSAHVWRMTDGEPLAFWSEKSAQIRADSLNRKGVRP